MGPDTFRLRELWLGIRLSTVPVRFHRRQAAFESVIEAPVLSETSGGPIVRYFYLRVVCSSPLTLRCG